MSVILDEINDLETAIIELANCPLSVQILVGDLADRYQLLARIKRRLKE